MGHTGLIWDLWGYRWDIQDLYGTYGDTDGSYRTYMGLVGT